MSSAVWKYEVPVRNRFELEMPAGARIVSLQLQYDRPVLWAVVDPEAPKVTRMFGVVGTGTVVDFKLPKHIGTFQLHGGKTVLHVFEIPTQAEAD